MKDEQPVISKKIYDDIMKIRKSGETNMMDRRTVQCIADQREMYALVCYLENSPKEYLRGIRMGFNVQEEPRS